MNEPFAYVTSTRGFEYTLSGWDAVGIMALCVLAGVLLAIVTFRCLLGPEDINEVPQGYYAAQERMDGVRKVKAISQQHMTAVPENLRAPERMLLVPYKDLMFIWDAADKVQRSL